MKHFLVSLAALCAFVCSLPAQPGGRGGAGMMGGGPRLGAAMARVFGEHKGFSAKLETEVKSAKADTASVGGKFLFLEGKSRLEIDIANAKGSRMPPGMAEQMKAMGMGEMVVISRPEKKLTYLIYPGLKSYAETEMSAEDAGGDASKMKVETTKLADETVDGQACVKNKVVVTDEDGHANEFTVWNSDALKKFPVQIEKTEKNTTVVMRFKDVKFERPDATSFDAPAGMTRYDNMQALMQGAMMKALGGAGGAAPGAAPKP
jgi:hypothetical protein